MLHHFRISYGADDWPDKEPSRTAVDRPNVEPEERDMPLGYRIYVLLKMPLMLVGGLLLVSGSVVPGLVLLGLAVVDMALVTPILVAREERREREARRG